MNQQPPYQQQPYQQQPYQPSYPSLPHQQNAGHPARGTATAALWLAIAGFLCFPFVPSLLALVLARSAGRSGYPGGRAKAATVLALVGLVVDAIAVVVYLLPG